MALSEKKQAMVDSFRDWLKEEELEYKEHANGHFRIFNEGSVVANVWATSETMITAVDTKHIGMPYVKKYIIGQVNLFK